MNHISSLLKQKKKEFGWSEQRISNKTGIHVNTINKHMNGKRDVSEIDLSQYCKCFGLDKETIQIKYLEGIDICNKDTLKTIVASTVAVGVSAGIGTLVFNGIQTLIKNKCKN
jgi:transcriptional regulator with XRE-family HTH domain